MEGKTEIIECRNVEARRLKNKQGICQEEKKTGDRSQEKKNKGYARKQQTGDMPGKNKQGICQEKQTGDMPGKNKQEICQDKTNRGYARIKQTEDMPG